MASYHLHIQGQVQGVGFRPLVYRLANELHLRGWVSNGVDGVHVAITGHKRDVGVFYREILQRPPHNARILNHSLHKVPDSDDPDFRIAESSSEGKPNLLLTPDLGLCADCRTEILSPANRRHHYAFTTCIHCGPRYSIINQLPYDRENTTMDTFEQCQPCLDEYHDPNNRRYYSQTNSCLTCGIELTLLNNQGKLISRSQDVILSLTCAGLAHGKIICLKGIGGFLLLTDAMNEQAIVTLRARKCRPRKPFALLYPSVERIKKDLEVSPEEEEALKGIEAPIVLLRLKQGAKPEICLQQIAPDLNRVGVMLPYTPLLALLMEKWNGPIIATSGNVSGSPIFYEDAKAINHLSSIADFFVANNRGIVVPQDDSVIQFAKETQRKIFLRRSRGFAPTYVRHSLQTEEGTRLAMGGELKSSFTLLSQGNLFVSQYLGDLETFETQESYSHTIQHFLRLLQASPEKVIIDQHPGYFSSGLGRKLAKQWDVPVQAVQHHLAHFSAVLEENQLVRANEPVLGVIWDGTGWGDDGAIWGGEFFTYKDFQFDRVAHLDYYDHLLADKFSREPRLSALSLCKNIQEAQVLLRPKFTETEWGLYTKILSQPSRLQTSSMGRFFDGIASLLGLCNKTSYEGEAAMYLETLAGKSATISSGYVNLAQHFTLNSFMRLIVKDILQGVSCEQVAHNVHVCLVHWIGNIAARENVKKIAFSGGVFQNGLLVDLIQKRLCNEYDLYFHKQLSPNDENIGLGQMVYDNIQESLTRLTHQEVNKHEIVTI